MRETDQCDARHTDLVSAVTGRANGSARLLLCNSESSAYVIGCSPTCRRVMARELRVLVLARNALIGALLRAYLDHEGYTPLEPDLDESARDAAERLHPELV